MMINIVARALAAVFAVALMGCTAGAPGFRDLSAPMGATTRFDPVEFSGDWMLVASFAPRQKGPVAVTLAPEMAHLRVTSDVVPQIAGLYREGIPGELLPISNAREPLIVMWVDEGFRTAAVGTVSGSVGLLLDRTGKIAPDRAMAAREIFEFYGWDVSQLKRTF